MLSFLTSLSVLLSIIFLERDGYGELFLYPRPSPLGKVDCPKGKTKEDSLRRAYFLLAQEVCPPVGRMWRGEKKVGQICNKSGTKVGQNWDKIGMKSTFRYATLVLSRK